MGQVVAVRTNEGETDLIEIGRGTVQGKVAHCHQCYLIYMMKR